MTTTNIHAEVMPLSPWTVTAVKEDKSCELLMIDITEEVTRQELAGYFTEQIAERGAIAGHATCLANPNLVLYFGTDHDAVVEHLDWCEAQKAKTAKPRSTKGFGS
ncbi:hypothetical protein N9C85_01015 [Synechococcus sp. AH-224-I15]|nr:hypothetical protein [Synechococcus sp. AH-224-I15]